VSAVRFRSTRLKTLSASLAGGPPPAAVAGPTTAAGTASGRGCRLVLEKSVGCTGPTSVHNRYIVVRYSGTHKNDIYKKKLKN
jgi:hypothetical protein